MKDTYKAIYTTGHSGLELNLFPEVESDLEGFYVRKGRYAIMAAKDLHVFGVTYKGYKEALDEAENMALINPGEKYIVIYLDTTAKADVPKAPKVRNYPVYI